MNNQYTDTLEIEAKNAWCKFDLYKDRFQHYFQAFFGGVNGYGNFVSEQYTTTLFEYRNMIELRSGNHVIQIDIDKAITDYKAQTLMDFFHKIEKTPDVLELFERLDVEFGEEPDVGGTYQYSRGELTRFDNYEMREY